jgi:hypothetical protein
MKNIKKLLNNLNEEGVFHPFLIFCYIFIITIIVVIVICVINAQLVGTVTENISDFGYADEHNYYVCVQTDDSDTYEYLNDIPIRDTQVFYFEYETVQSYITFDVDRGDNKRNIKIYSTQKIK